MPIGAGGVVIELQHGIEADLLYAQEAFRERTIQAVPVRLSQQLGYADPIAFTGREVRDRVERVAVGPIDLEVIASRAAGDRIGAAVIGDSEERIVAGAAVENVGSIVRVVVGVEGVVSVIAVNGIVAGGIRAKGIVSGAAVDRVAGGLGIDRIVSGAAV